MNDDKTRSDAARREHDRNVAQLLTDLDRRMPKQLSDADYAEMSAIQARADQIAAIFGDSAPRALQGETPLAYRKRLISKFQKHSPDYADIDLAPIADAKMLAIVEKRVYADAQVAGMNPVGLPEGTLREVVTTDRTGRRNVSFVGSPDAWMRDFKSPVRRLVGIDKGKGI